MVEDKLVSIRATTYLAGTIRGGEGVLTVNKDSVVKAIIGNMEYYLSLLTGKLYKQACAIDPKQQQCGSSFILDNEHATFNLSEIGSINVTEKFNLVAKGLITKIGSTTFFTVNSDGCSSGKDYTVIDSINKHMCIAYDSKCFLGQGVRDAELRISLLPHGIATSDPFLRGLNACEVFFIKNKKFCELINHFAGTAVNSIGNMVNDFMLSSENECAFSRMNTINNHDSTYLPTLSSNNSLALSNEEDVNNLNSLNLSNSTLIAGATIITISAFSIGVLTKHYIMPKIAGLWDKICGINQEDINNNMFSPEIISLAENDVEIELSGNNQD